MRTNQFRLLWVALLSLSEVLPAAATDYEAADYLPLAVGNSWTYEHEYYDGNDVSIDYYSYSEYWDQWPAIDEPLRFPEFTITVLNTEVIDGKTYYVISNMPAGWPPAPPHFIAGKNLRWDGTHLMERTADGEQATFRFDATSADYTWPPTDLSPFVFSSTGITAYLYRAYPFEFSNLFRITYLVSTTEGSDQVSVEAGLKPVPWYYFKLDSYAAGKLVSHDPDLDFVLYRSCKFLAGYGVLACEAGQFSAFQNYLVPLRAVIGGTPVEFADALIPTGISSSSWGQIKQSWLAGERRDP